MPISTLRDGILVLASSAAPHPAKRLPFFGGLGQRTSADTNDYWGKKLDASREFISLERRTVDNNAVCL